MAALKPLLPPLASLTDRIDVQVLENAGLQPSLIQYKDYICAEILADSLAFLPVLNAGTEIEVNDVTLKVNILLSMFLNKSEDMPK